MKNHISKYTSAQYGFTLIELMISLVLGLLISAAVMQVFLTSQRVDRIQTAGSEIQDKAVFGIQGIESQVRLANLGNDGVAINDTTALGGIVLTAIKVGSNSRSNNDSDDDDSDDDDDDTADILVGGSNVVIKNNLKKGFWTRSGDMESEGNANSKWKGSLTNTEINSDQLTIQYINTTGRLLYDCEGAEIAVGARVIARYFVNENNIKTKKVRKNLNLNCEAGRIINNRVRQFGRRATGETIIENIDQFNIRLGVQRSIPVNGTLTYQYADMTVEEYMVLDSKPPITNIKIAILARSTANSPEATNGPFSIFGVEQNLKDQSDAPNYLRRVYETNVLLRNARVMRIIDNNAS